MYPEFIKNLGKMARKWLMNFMNDILATKNIPKEFRKSKVVVNSPSSYRPISLLSVCYKLLERLIYNRIYDAVDKMLPIEYAGFRKGRSCVDQILALSTYIESGFKTENRRRIG